MLLMQLPVEILMQIVDYLGPSFFREDIGRLVICKQWFNLVQDVCFRDLYLSPWMLRRLYAVSALDGSAALIRASLKGLYLDLMRFQAGGEVTNPTHADALARGQELLARWISTLDEQLRWLARLAHQCPKLRLLRIRATDEYYPWLPHGPYRDYLSASTLTHFLGVQHLTVLELDLCGTRLTTMEPMLQADMHVCENIGALLLTLHRLRLRMRSICPAVLRPPPHTAPLPLREALIKLTRPRTVSAWSTSTLYTTRCGTLRGEFRQLRILMEAQAVALASQLEAPERVRVLGYSMARLRVQAFDALSGRRMLLPDDRAWAADGETDRDFSDREY